MVRGIDWRGFAKIVVVFSALLVTHGLVTQAGPQATDSATSAKVHYQNAAAAQSRGDWQTAKSESLQAEKLAPQNSLVHYDLALAYSHNPQSSDTIGQAKQHYQNAVAAIAKSDWGTAKGELLQAEKLAPQNALIHYDLALVYSHTGQINSARVELTKALQLGLPAEQKQAAAELKRKLANTSNAPGTTSKTSQARSSPQESAVHTLNTVITTELGATLNNYRPFGFTYEVSTGKLWWQRLTNSGCEQWPNGANTSFGAIGARLTDLDPDGIVATRDSEGSKISITCRNKGSCFETWLASNCGAMASWKHSQDDSVETFSKTIYDNPLIFRDKPETLEILTTGDPDATQKAINLLKQLIASAPPPSEAYLAEAARQKAEETSAEANKQAEKLAADQALAAKMQSQLSQLQGHWHARLGGSTHRSGKIHYAGSTYGSSNGTVRIWDGYDYDLVLNSPNGNSVSGRYSYGNEEWKLRGSELPNFENDCFILAGNCYTSYSWNKTQVFLVVASVADDGSIQVNLTHDSCQGDCKESSEHLADRSGSIEIVTPFIMQLTVGDETYKLTKQ